MLLSKKLRSSGGADAKLYVDDVFSTYLYTGNGTTQTITNGIDLAGEGGLVWTKNRVNGAYWHELTDTARGANNNLFSNTTNAQGSSSDVMSFNSTGFGLRLSSGYGNQTGDAYASWTFRKAPKFFDVVTYTGDGVAGRQIAHDLGVAPGMVIVKTTSNVKGWAVWHRGAYFNTGNAFGNLESTNPFNNSGHVYWGDGTSYIAPTETHFTVSTQDEVNNPAGWTYVAYLFAHDPEPDGLIQCGSYTGNGSATGPIVNLGWEPQYLMIKNTTGTGNWQIIDSMRGNTVGGVDALLQPNLTNASLSVSHVSPTSTGFQVTSTSTDFNTSASTYIYMAIRRPNKPPESGSEVFAIDNRNASLPSYTSNFPVDLVIQRWVSGASPNVVYSRLTGTVKLATNTTGAESGDAYGTFDFMSGWNSTNSASTSTYSWMFRRAPGFFDVVCYTGDGIAGRTVNHSLGVVPEMMIVKARNSAQYWAVYHAGNTTEPETDWLALQTTDATSDASTVWNDTLPSSSVFTVGNAAVTNANSATNYIAYLFATLPGISKVGSYTGNGSSQTIDCGFSTGARFILIKRTDLAGDWYVWDSVRGIVAANDPHLSLNTTAAEVTTNDSVDPESTGFIVNQNTATNINVSAGTYIFLSIA